MEAISEFGKTVRGRREEGLSRLLGLINGIQVYIHSTNKA